MRIVRRFEFDAGHRVENTVKCKHPHGHRYVAEVEIEGDVQADGMVVDFGDVKEEVGGWIDAFLDHAWIVHADDEAMKATLDTFGASAGFAPRVFVMSRPATAENIAAELLASLGEVVQVNYGLRLRRVRLWETPNCSAVAEAGGDA